jgi:CDP-paratose synthetase
MKKKKILISGINGYLARNLANELVSLDHFEVVGFGRNSHKHELLKEDIIIIPFDEIASYIQCEDIYIIIHAATNYGRSNDSIESILSTNLILPIQLYSTARNNNVPYFVNIDTILPREYSEYALSKKQFVDWAKQLNTSSRFSSNRENNEIFKFINIEFEHFYGPGASTSNFVSWLINQLQENTQDIKLTKCNQEREFLYISDAVSALMTILKNLGELKSFESFTVGSGKPILLREFIFKAKDVFDSKSTFNFGAIPLRENQEEVTFHSHYNIKKLGWEAKTSIELGLNKIKNHTNE